MAAGTSRSPRPNTFGLNPMRPLEILKFSVYGVRSWYQLRTPYTENFKISNGRIGFRPNVFGLGDRDVPAAILRKQTSLNMTFSAELLGFRGQLGPRNRVGVSAYLSEFQHQDIGLRGCVNATGMCLYTELRRNGTVDVCFQPFLFYLLSRNEA